MVASIFGFFFCRHYFYNNFVKFTPDYNDNIIAERVAKEESNLAEINIQIQKEADALHSYHQTVEPNVFILFSILLYINSILIEINSFLRNCDSQTKILAYCQDTEIFGYETRLAHL